MTDFYNEGLEKIASSVNGSKLYVIRANSRMETVQESIDELIKRFRLESLGEVAHTYQYSPISDKKSVVFRDGLEVESDGLDTIPIINDPDGIYVMVTYSVDSGRMVNDILEIITSQKVPQDNVWVLTKYDDHMVEGPYLARAMKYLKEKAA